VWKTADGNTQCVLQTRMRLFGLPLIAKQRRLCAVEIDVTFAGRSALDQREPLFTAGDRPGRVAKAELHLGQYRMQRGCNVRRISSAQHANRAPGIGAGFQKIAFPARAPGQRPQTTGGQDRMVTLFANGQQFIGRGITARAVIPAFSPALLDEVGKQSDIRTVDGRYLVGITLRLLMQIVHRPLPLLATQRSPDPHRSRQTGDKMPSPGAMTITTALSVFPDPITTIGDRSGTLSAYAA
jgi:hypothetical protein